MDDIRIIYPWQGGIAVLQIVDGSGARLEEVARAEVPHGTPFRIIHVADLPADDCQREAWHVDAEDFSDGVGERLEDGAWL